MGKEKTVKMWFNTNMYYNDLVTPLYEAGKEYDVPERMVSRWIKRGGVLVADQPTPAPIPKPVQHAPTPEPVKPPEKAPEHPPVDEDKEKEKTKPEKTGKNK